MNEKAIEQIKPMPGKETQGDRKKERKGHGAFAV
jgi:hypothetical protein